MAKTALITGAAGGLGKTYAEYFLKAGYRVVLADIQDELGLKTEKELSAYGECAYVHCDVTIPGDRAALVEKTVALFGSLEVLVNNAGVASRIFVEDISEEHYDFIQEINQKSVFFLSKEAAKKKKKQRYGKIINVTSPRAVFADTRRLPYGVTKRAVMAITEYLGICWARYGINVNAVSLGMILTPMSAHHLQEDPDFLTKVANIHPIRRVLTPDDPAKVVLFLASDEASSLVGQTITVDGGFSILNQAEAPTMPWPEE